MTVEEANRKALRIVSVLQDAQLMFIELKGQQTSKLKGFAQSSIDLLIDNINEDFFKPLIDNIIGEF